jgi:hypothetical protein
MKGFILTQFEVKAIQDGRLSQLRRVIKPQPPEGAWPIYDDLDGYEGEGWAFQYTKSAGVGTNLQINFNPVFYLPNKGKCPYGNPGDILFGKETWQQLPSGFDEIPPEDWYIYKVTDELSAECTGWRPSNLMPQKAARIFLSLKNIWPERLQDITEAEAIAAGVERDGEGWKSYDIIQEGPHKGEPHPFNIVPYKNAVLSYQSFWDSDHPKVGQNWTANLWTWVFEVEKADKP